ncbi:MAG TPA: VWA domain-containing protein [Acidimicrobiales bacterium]|nr:VWA domain-containing protein [Acidimicrobiales bacterium]
MSDVEPAPGVFPLTALVGQEDLQVALVLSAVDPAIGGVLVRGEKGSGKTTAARGLADVLPGHAPFVELPLGAGEERVVGSLDVRAALSASEHRFQPGLLAQAHGGVLYVDEVNLLADHLVDVLLDVAVSGVNRVERDGLSESHPARFVLVGSMNPEEGELRPQLLDRFGLAVAVVAPTDPVQRAEAVRRRLAFDADPVAFADRFAEQQDDLRSRLASAAAVPLEPGLPDKVAAICSAAGAEGLRADLVICRAAAALAGWRGRRTAGPYEVREVAPLALAHRRRSPWDSTGQRQEELAAILDEVLGGPPPPPAPPPPPPPPAPPVTPAVRDVTPSAEGPTGDAEEVAPVEDAAPEDGPPQAGPVDGGEAADRDAGPGGEEDGGPAGVPPPETAPEPVWTDDVFVRAPAPRHRRRDGAPTPEGRTGETAQGSWGRQIGARVPDGTSRGPVAAVATVTAAAARQAGSGSVVAGAPLRLVEADVREAVLVRPVGRLVVLVVDASGSMGAEQRLAAAKAAVLSFLVDAYQRRDRVALVAFHDESAEVVLRPTGSTEVARARLASWSTGGRTPLAAGIEAALSLVRTSKSGRDHALLVLVTDGRATTAADGKDPVAASLAAAAAVRRSGIDAVVVDCEQGRTRLGLARQLAEAMGADYVQPPDPSDGALTAAIRTSLVEPDNG